MERKRNPAVGGYVKMPMDNELKGVLLRQGLKCDKMIGNAWVPRWVKNAVDIYKKGDGFAGLSLEEFLASMRPQDDNAKSL